MNENFDIDKIVNYLEKHKSELSNLYKWKVNVDKLIDLDTLTSQEVVDINSLENSFEKTIKLRKIIEQKLNLFRENEKGKFKALCIWIIKDWGGIKTANEEETLNLIDEFIDNKVGFKRIASVSKVGSFMFPNTHVIYDSRVAYSLNWILLSENAGEKYFPIPEGRNSKMNAFDLSVLIRLKNISHYKTDKIEEQENRLFIKNSDKKIFINEKEAYNTLNILIKSINEKLWKGDDEKTLNLYYTEMLLFSIADRQIFIDITNNFWKN